MKRQFLILTMFLTNIFMTNFAQAQTMTSKDSVFHKIPPAAMFSIDNNNFGNEIGPIGTPRKRPSRITSDFGYGPLIIDLGDNTPFYVRDNWVDIDAGDVHVVDAIADINQICPQHRSVGETSVLTKPKASYEILEGVVTRDGANISAAEFPTSHYTHDFDFDVIPDSQFNYLLGAEYTFKYPNTSEGRNCLNLETLLRDTKYKLNQASDSQKPNFLQKIKALEAELRPCLNTRIVVENDYQKEIAVEWESGLAQDGCPDNPAVPENIKGNSFGFFSAGHTLKDVIWNWPSADDRVHVDGIWIWDRGHNAPTEIHPPHFLSIQRKLPVSFILNSHNEPEIRNLPEDKYLGTRVDVFASAQGTVMWNNKGLKPFAQTVDMKRKDYSFSVIQPFAKPPAAPFHTISLKCKFIKQKGDNFPVNPIIQIQGNKVQITVPWKTANVSNDAIFARTFVVYWDDYSDVITSKTIKVVEAQKPKLYSVELMYVYLKTPMDGEVLPPPYDLAGNHGYGDFRIFCNVGNNWVFLNEFDPTINTANILRSGLGRALDNRKFEIGKTFNIYADTSSTFLFRLGASGWEADAVNSLMMGHVLDEYSRNGKPLNELFGNNAVALNDGGKADDKIGTAHHIVTPLNVGFPQIEQSLESYDGDHRYIFVIAYKIKEIPFSASNSASGVLHK